MLKTILVVDDDETYQFVTERLLKIYNIAESVVGFIDPSRALHEIKSGLSPDLIILDINMPIMNGWEFLREYEKTTIKIPVIVSSSSNNLEDQKKAISHKSVIAYMMKPIDIQELKIQINRLST